MSVLKPFRNAIGRLLAYMGVAVFFVGDRYLHEIKHMDYLLSLMIALSTTGVLILLAYAIGFRPKQKTRTDES